MFTLGGGGAHCLGQALRRERSLAERPAIDAARVIADLRELDRRTGGAEGARRLCWGPEWRDGAGLPLRAAGRDWSRAGERRGRQPLGVPHRRAGTGARGRLACRLGPERRLARRRARRDGGCRSAARLGGREAQSRRARWRCVDWADEEGARFGRSLFGSSAARARSTRPSSQRPTTPTVAAPPRCWRENGVDLPAAPSAVQR